MEKALLDRSILDATSQVWKLTLGFDLTPASALGMHAPSEKILCVRVNFSGSWKSQVVMQLPWELGEYAAWRIIGMNESESPSLQQISIVLKEVAAAMADSIKLNLPQPSEPEDASVEMQTIVSPMTNAVVRQAFKGPWGHSIIVTLIERELAEILH